MSRDSLKSLFTQRLNPSLKPDFIATRSRNLGAVVAAYGCRLHIYGPVAPALARENFSGDIARPAAVFLDEYEPPLCRTKLVHDESIAHLFAPAQGPVGREKMRDDVILEVAEHDELTRRAANE